MNTEKEKQMSESFLLGAILAFVGGFLDAYTYINRGHVFAFAETGNILLMTINLVDGHFAGVTKYILPICSFTLGVLVTELIQHRYKQNQTVHWRQITTTFEILTLFVVAFIPANDINNICTNTMVAFVSSIQFQSFRRINGNAVTTTMCTGNLRSGTEHMYNFLITKDRTRLVKSITYFGIILVFITGACTSAIVSKFLSIKAVLVPCVALCVVLMLMADLRHSSHME